MKRASLLFALAGCAAAHAAEDATVAESELGSKSCDVRSYGAKGDGTTNDTAAIQRAIDDCAGRGEVHLRAGRFRTGTITLKSAMIFHVHGDAALVGSRDDADYPDTNPPSDNTQLANCKKALVYAEGVHDLHITGTGTIDGQGTLAKWSTSPERTRPMALFVAGGKDVYVENVTVKDSAMWSVVVMEVDGVTIRNVTVDSTHGSTRDGIDIVDSHDVLVEGCTISSEDDSICLKSGSAHGVKNVVVRNDHVKTSGVANALKLGTASYGGFENVSFDTIDVAHADKAAMAIESVDGAAISNLVFRNITFDDVGSPVFVLIGDRGLRPAYVARRIGSIDGVRFEHVRGKALRHDWGGIVSGFAAPNGTVHRVENLVFDDVDIAVHGGATAVPADPLEYAGQYPDPNLWGRVPASGVFVRHAGTVSFIDTRFTDETSDARPTIDARDVSRLSVD